MESTSNIIIFVGCISAWIGAIVQLLFRRRGKINLINFFLLLCIGIVQLHSWIYFSGLLYEYPNICLINIPILYFTGPLLYFYFNQNTTDIKFSSRFLLHYLPGFLSAVLIMPYYLKDSTFKISLIKLIYEKPGINKILSIFSSPDNMYEVTILLLIIGAMISIIIYLFPLLRKTINVLNQESITRNYLVTKKYLLIIPLIFNNLLSLLGSMIRYMFFLFKKTIYLLNKKVSEQNSINIITYIFIVLLIFNAILSLLGLMISDAILKTSAIVLTIILCGAYLLGLRNPASFESVRNKAQKFKYKRSHINGLNVNEILGRLHQIMVEEKAFADEDITLENIANELTITLHQLSQIINEKLNKNFKTFIREYRIKEACDLLINNPDRSIISIAYAVGYNSKSAFNSAFAQITGLTPTKYREKYYN